MGGKLKFYYKILIKCAQTQLFVSFEQSFCIFQHFVTYYVRYFVRFDPDPQFKAAGSGSALRRTAGSGSAKNECGSTARVQRGKDAGWDSSLFAINSIKQKHTRHLYLCNTACMTELKLQLLMQLFFQLLFIFPVLKTCSPAMTKANQLEMLVMAQGALIQRRDRMLHLLMRIQVKKNRAVDPHYFFADPDPALNFLSSGSRQKLPVLL